MDPKSFSILRNFLQKCTVIIFLSSLAYETLSLDSKFQACMPQSCGNGPYISYPFWIFQEQDSFRGYPNFEITCKNNSPVLIISDDNYFIKDIWYSNNTFVVVNVVVYEEMCPIPLQNATFDRTPFSLSFDNVYFSFLYNCTEQPDYHTYPDRTHSKTCNDDKRHLGLKLGIGIGCGVGVVLIASTVFILYRRRKKAIKYAQSYSFSQGNSLPPQTDSEIGVYPGVQHFSYNELERATNKFDSARVLGDGGFGTVYYGKLRDGRPVAVKRLYENNYKRFEQFWNEINILGQLRHPNLVSLYGYTSRHSRELLLVYEYISNGTVADHLHGERAIPGSLSWSTRLEIAIETASALTYLHAYDIIHRDVKTDNILLDENFCVKVADFGLSRLFPLNATHVSTAPQGTPGYVDPEYHECYQLTDKSDVFSFGVVLIELISSKPAVDITRHRHEINLSNMAVNKIQNQALHELVDPSLGFESDYSIKAMITSVAAVAFKCLQGGKDMRPTMREVHDDLKEVQSGNYNKVKLGDQMHVSANEDVLLKSGPQTLSPDSVTVKWVSNSSTSNASI
ncbi:hypothetical protein SLE2022_345550 [Rubroshorea leprosula]